jgi:hypothetical protein
MPTPPTVALPIPGTQFSPRVLTITAELRIPPGLRRDIRFVRVEEAVNTIRTQLAAAAGTAFPWADTLVVAHDWSYRWDTGLTEIALPKTEHNTVQ